MRKTRLIFGLLLAAALFSGPAFAQPESPTPTATPATATPTPTPTIPPSAQNGRGNTSQKGSLLIFPLIDTRTEDTATTIVDISNDDTQSVHVQCYYVNERKDRRDFDFDLSPKATVTWDVLTHTGSIQAAVFPTGGSFPGDPLVGELICFAVDTASSTQVRFNHLTGTATVVLFTDADANQPKQAFRYNAWAFTARGTGADNSPVGTPGRLDLTGGGTGTYDACPLYLIGLFGPSAPTTGPSGATLGGVTFHDSDLSVSVCNQDLRQDFTPHFTKLKFTVWNEFENSFSGSYQCSDSVLTFGLDPEDQPATGGLVGTENFTFSTLGTRNARFQVQGIASTQCSKSENTGLVAVLASSIGIGGTPGTEIEDTEIGSTLFGAGSEAGFVLWDPGSATVPQKAGKKH